jgi:hypothetical protein
MVLVSTQSLSAGETLDLAMIPLLGRNLADVAHVKVQT